MTSDPCNIELGNGRYVRTTEWNGELRIDVRECETRGDKKRTILDSTKMETSRRSFRRFGQGLGREDKLFITHWWKRICRCKSRQRLCGHQTILDPAKPN